MKYAAAKKKSQLVDLGRIVPITQERGRSRDIPKSQHSRFALMRRALSSSCLIHTRMTKKEKHVWLARYAAKSVPILERRKLLMHVLGYYIATLEYSDLSIQ